MTSNVASSLGLCVLFVAPTAGAQIVKCIDAEGSVTYADVRCLRTEKTAIVDTKASTSVLDFSSIRAQKGRVLAPVAAPAPVYSAPPAPPPAKSEPFVVDRSPKSATTPTRGY